MTPAVVPGTAVRAATPESQYTVVTAVVAAVVTVFGRKMYKLSNSYVPCRSALQLINAASLIHS